ncbi:hypothetical protein B296_00003739, partial [Ensete ventricosum]
SLRLCKYFEDMNPMSTQAFMGAQAAPCIDAVVDSFVSEDQKAEKEQYGGTGNRILANLTQEPTTTPGVGVTYTLLNLCADYDEGGHSSASTQETASVGGTTNTRKRKRVEEYVPLVHTAKKPTGSVLSLKNSSPFKSNETGKTPQSASMVRPGGIQLVVRLCLICSSRKLDCNIVYCSRKPFAFTLLQSI